MKLVKDAINKLGASKALIFVTLILLQIVIYVFIYRFLSEYVSYVFGGFSIITIILLIVIMNDRSNPMYKISWIILILTMQGIGALLYIYVHMDSLYKSVKKLYFRYKKETSKELTQNSKVLSDLKKESKFVSGISNYCYNICGYPTYHNTETKYLKIGEEYFATLLEELNKAKKFILLEYFIINNDYTWQSILNVLLKKVREGVEVKVMYDGFGSLITLPNDYDEYLNRCGIDVAVFSKVRPFLALHQNNRSHRKILVIDGEVGFMGGINLADEYANRIAKHGHWKDTGIMLKGDAVNSLTMMFFELWGTCTRNKIDYDKYISNKKCESDGYVIPYSDSPYDDINLGEDIYLNIINSATDYVYITTPYLIIDDNFIKALDNASKRGVRVVIIVPHIPDKKYVYYMANAQYKVLIESGVGIYEYTPGFIHAKMFLSDDKVGVVGSINLDYRSLYLHFECATLLYNTSSLKDIKKDIEETISKSIPVTKRYLKKIPIKNIILGKILKLFAPLM